MLNVTDAVMELVFKMQVQVKDLKKHVLFYEVL